MVKGIDDFVSLPKSFERCQFACEPCRAHGITVMPTRYGFVMGQERAWLIQRLPAALVEPETQINIIIGHCEISLVQPAYGHEALTCDDKAGSGNGRCKLGQGVPAKISFFAWIDEAVGVPGGIAHPDYNACMLDAAIGI